MNSTIAQAAVLGGVSKLTLRRGRRKSEKI